jgi:hypothetical protein
MCLFCIGGFGGVVEYLVSPNDVFHKVNSSFFIEPHEDRIDLQSSGFNLDSGILNDRLTQKGLLIALHGPKFNLTIFSVWPPQPAIFSPLLI